MCDNATQLSMLSTLDEHKTAEDDRNKNSLIKAPRYLHHFTYANEDASNVNS